MRPCGLYQSQICFSHHVSINEHAKDIITISKCLIYQRQKTYHFQQHYNFASNLIRLLSFTYILELHEESRNHLGNTELKSLHSARHFPS